MAASLRRRFGPGMRDADEGNPMCMPKPTSSCMHTSRPCYYVQYVAPRLPGQRSKFGRPPDVQTALFGSHIATNCGSGDPSTVEVDQPTTARDADWLVSRLPLTARCRGRSAERAACSSAWAARRRCATEHSGHPGFLAQAVEPARTNQGERTVTEQAKEHRGFAAMDRAAHRELARSGGQAAHRSGLAHKFDSNEAREAGRKGGAVNGLGSSPHG